MGTSFRSTGWLALVGALACGSETGSDGTDAATPADAAPEASSPSRDSAVAPRDAPVSTGDACEQLRITSEPVPTHVLVVLDSSGSMYQPDDGIDRWAPAVMAVKNVTEALESDIRFGLMLFPSDDFCGPGELAVSPDVNTAHAISTELSADPEDITGGGTPTAMTLAAADETLGDLDGDRFVLLITDGAPACNESISESECQCVAAPQYCNEGTGSHNCLDDARTVETIETLAAAEIQTYVIGYDTSEWSEVLTRMAVAGDTGRESYIEVSDGAALEEAIQEVSRSVVPCRFELADPPGDIRYVSVKVDGEQVDHVSVQDDDSGWDLAGEATVELLGNSCALVQDGEQHDVDITVECEPVLF